MPKRWCIECNELFTRADTGTQRCAACQAAADMRATQRRARAAAGRGSATARGYGVVYQRRRKAVVAAALREASPCAICGHPCLPGQAIVAHHADGKPATADPRTCRLEPAHSACNSAGHRA